MSTQLCRRCQFHPASARIFGYCSWDCHDADEDQDERAVAAQERTVAVPLAAHERDAAA
jgi:hypothetical protein